MATRIGVELSPVVCRIVEIEAPNGWRLAGRDTRVRSYSVSPRLSGETRALLARLRGRQAAVVVWGMRGDQRQAIVGVGRYDGMRREAMNSLRYAGIDTRGVLTDIAPAGPRPKDGPRRPVVMALASKNDVATAVRPLVAAGIRIRSVVMPATALGSLARLRRGGATTGGIEAYVALEETRTCVALVREHVLVAARELPWGYLDQREPLADPIPREELATRLAGELTTFFSTAGVDLRAVTVVCVCGGLPELRSVTAPMMEQLDVEIEPMDSMFGIDAHKLPGPADHFRDRGVELRLAWAAAADWNAPLNLLRDRQHRATSSALARAAVVAGVGAGVSLGWALQGAGQLETPIRNRPVTRMASVMREPESMRAPMLRPVGTSPGASRRAPIAAATAPAVPAQRPETPLVPVPREAPSPAPFARPEVSGFSPELGTILFASDRKLAMIDGRIVEAGDEVTGALVLEIGPTSVMLRDQTGRVRRLSIGSNGR